MGMLVWIIGRGEEARLAIRLASVVVAIVSQEQRCGEHCEEKLTGAFGDIVDVLQGVEQLFEAFRQSGARQVRAGDLLGPQSSSRVAEVGALQIGIAQVGSG